MKARRILGMVEKIATYPRLTRRALGENLNDLLLGLPSKQITVERAIDEGIAWIGRAQDNSASHDGGVARHFNLLTGWATSYPETTGYIIPTLLDYARVTGDEKVSTRSRRMLDWLVLIQLPDGAFQGGLIDSYPVVPVTFNTGQILIGLASGVREFGDQYRESMRRAADWLVRNQDSDGCWRKCPSPFARAGEKSYDTHVAWGLLEASQFDCDRGYAEAALHNIDWALASQKENGWFAKCCLTDPDRPLTHTLGYAFRGIVEAYRRLRSDQLRAACVRTADGLLSAVRSDGFMAGRLTATWDAASSWTCLTGSAQIACCWFILHGLIGNADYLRAARLLTGYLRRTVRIDCRPEIRGALKGSFPISGAYCAYEYPNWATKFLVDALTLEREAAAAD
jgi:hypothetical protein